MEERDKTPMYAPGDLVRYKKPNGTHENGIVKSVTQNGVFVVYHCAGEWERYEDYTAALTRTVDLKSGWK